MLKHSARAMLVASLALVALALPAPAQDMKVPDSVTVEVLESSPQRIVLDFALGDYELKSVPIDGEKYAILTLAGEPVLLDEGAPALPLVCRSAIIPDMAEMGLSVVSADFREYQVKIAPSKGNLLRTVDPATVPYEFGAAYRTNAFYPGNLAELSDAYILRDHRAATIRTYPFQYNPVTGVLRVYTELTVELTPIGPGKINVKHEVARKGPSRAFEELYRNQFVNYDAERYDPLAEEGDLLIICHDAWLPNIAPLVDHKNGIGIATTAVGVSTIPGGNNATAIKNYIQGIYNTTDLAFVLLVGDAAQIATPSASGGASDPSYSKLAGGDDYPDILVGRFSAETAAQVDTQVLRTIEYEQMPATTTEWFKRGMGVASNQGTGDDGEYDDEHVDNIRDDLLAYGYTLVDQIYDYSGTAAQVTSGLNAGRGVINYCGHGSTTSWSSTGFSNTHVNALVNDNMLPFIVSVACVNGDFDGATCFGEAWLRATNGSNPTGAIGAYMSSINQSWDPPMEAQDEFNILLTNEAYWSYGAYCFAGSCSMMDDYGSGGVEHVQYLAHLRRSVRADLRRGRPAARHACYPIRCVGGRRPGRRSVHAELD